jgi:hypothetical protein
MPTYQVDERGMRRKMRMKEEMGISSGKGDISRQRDGLRARHLGFNV